MALILALISASSAQVKPKSPSSPPTKDSPFQSRVLPNGLEVIVYEDHTVPLVTVEYAAKAGSFIEAPPQSGFSHLYEHLFFKSNRATKSGEDYIKNIGQLGIAYNSSTHEEHVNSYLTTTTNNFPTALRFLRDATRYPVFDSKELSQEREVVINEIAYRESSPFSLIQREMTSRLFFQYPNRKDPSGNRQVIRSATPGQLQELYAKYWVPNNSAVLVSGDVKADEAFRQVEQLFGDWQKSADPFAQTPLVEHPPLAKSSGAILQQPVQNVLIEIGWQGPSIGLDTSASYAADVFSSILRQPDSRFQRNLVDSRLATGVNLGYFTQRTVGPITLVMQTTPEKSRAALRALHNEIAHFTDADYFSEQELQNAKALLSADDLYDREKPSEYIHTLSFWWASTGIEYLKNYQRAIAGISKADINRYLQAYIKGKPRIGLVLLSKEAQQQIRLNPEEVIGQ